MVLLKNTLDHKGCIVAFLRLILTLCICKCWSVENMFDQMTRLGRVWRWEEWCQEKLQKQFSVEMQLPTFGVFPLFVKWMIECQKITLFFKSRMLNIKYCWRATFGHFLGWRGLSLALIQLCWGRYAPAGEMTRHPWEFLSNNYLHIVQLEKYAFMEYVYSACKISAIERFFLWSAQSKQRWSGK